MSFSDLSNGSSKISRADSAKPFAWNSAQASGNGVEKFVLNDAFVQIGESLRELQMKCDKVEKLISELKSRPTSLQKKNEIQLKFDEASGLGNRIKSQFESQQRILESKANPKTTGTIQNRLALGKLLKEYEQMEVKLGQLASRISTIRIVEESKNNFPINAPVDETLEAVPTRSAPKLVRVYQDRDVDLAIVEEREKELLKIHNDLLIVNEMYKDMAKLVEGQNQSIDVIVQKTEEAHERAEAGLHEVTQASQNQSSCIIS